MTFFKTKYIMPPIKMFAMATIRMIAQAGIGRPPKMYNKV